MTEILPRGIWYEKEKKRYRVRRYHNKVAYLKGYYRTLSEAKNALEELSAELSKIPKLSKRRRGSPGEAPVPQATIKGTADAVRNRQQYDPDILRRKSA